MRKLKLQMQISIDGFVSTGPNDEQNWVTWAWDEIKQYVLELIDTTDTIVIGRKLAVDYIPHWQNVVTKPDDPFYELAQKIVNAKKLFSQNPLINWNLSYRQAGGIILNLQKEHWQMKSKN